MFPVAVALALSGLVAVAPPASAQEPTGTARDTTSVGTDSARRAGPDATPPASDPAHARVAPRARAAALGREAAIEVDGRLDEPIWRQAAAVTEFWQREPREGEPASQRTEIRFLHDGKTLYIGARLYDDRGSAGVTARLVRRDGEAQADELALTFDPFHDHVTQTRFTINPAGVRGDAYGPGGSNPDPSWDPVWRGVARVDSLGWTAELAIPFSQLRFPRGADAPWGLQITRRVHRLNEVSVWSFWGLDEQGGPSRYGHLEGMSSIEASATKLEILPYAVTQMDARGTLDEDDPFRSATQTSVRAGADLAWLVNSNFTLNATINPDFGQVEVDPAVVNLSAFETFFPEKREFFIQGQGRFGFGDFWCRFCSNTSSLTMLHTRRIGRAPQAGFLARQAGGHADVPGATTILGAAKLTGQTAGGTSVGLLGAVTAREEGRAIGADGEAFRQEVEPRTGYFVGRAKQDFLDGELRVGGIFTGVARDFDDPALSHVLNRHSEGAGVDAEYWWGGHTYHLLFSSAVTNISGTPEAIQRAQRSSARYLQRPDREGGGNGLFTNAYDPTLTSMRGWGLYTRMAKDAGNWRWETALNVRSPGFENNDISFLTRTDFVWMNANLSHTWTRPTSWYRALSFTAGGQQELNFDGDVTGRQLHAHAFVETPFYWNVGGFAIWRPSTLDTRLTRGGPAVRSPETRFVLAFLSTDRRRPVVGSVEPSYGWNEDGGKELSLPLSLTLKPASNVFLTLNPTYRVSTSISQYVRAVDDATAEDFYGRRYVFATLDQKSLSMTTRLSWTFSPGMSLEAFVQPLIAANDFHSFKEFEAPREREKLVYGEDVGTIRGEGEPGSRTWFVDPDGIGPAPEFSFADPNFVFRSLRGNVVFRWEYAPGSTLYLVWTQNRSSTEPFGDLRFGRDADALFGAPGDNVFLAKLTYYLGL